MTLLRAAVLVTVLAGLAACDTAPAVPTASQVAPSAGPVSSAAATPASQQPSSPRVDAACPATAAALQKAAGLPTGYKIDPDHIRCGQKWATAGVIAADPARQGDGVILFEYKAGGWIKVTEGSALECSRYGIPEEIGDQLGCHS